MMMMRRCHCEWSLWSEANTDESSDATQEVCDAARERELAHVCRLAVELSVVVRVTE